MAALFFVGIYVIVLVAYLLKEPVTIYNEQGVEINQLTDKLEVIENARPNIEPYEPPYVDERPLVQSRGQETRVVPLNFFHIKLANNPSVRTEQATARKVFAKLTYYNEAGRKLLGPIIGRWGDTDQPGTRSPFTPTRDLQAVEIESSGLPRELDLALRHPQTNSIYAFNNDSYFVEDWRKPDFIINEATIYIQVELSGENADDTELWMLLENSTDSQNIRLTEPPDRIEE